MFELCRRANGEFSAGHDLPLGALGRTDFPGQYSRPSPRFMCEWREKRQLHSRFSGIGAFRTAPNWLAAGCLRISWRNAGFLEKQGFRFIELNYRPVLAGLGGFSEDTEITVCSALPEDAKEISGFAAQIFTTGRLHVDPLVGPEIGNRRYGVWAVNAFHHPDQRVLKCQMGGRIVAFIVVEQPTPRQSVLVLGRTGPWSGWKGTRAARMEGSARLPSPRGRG